MKANNHSLTRRNCRGMTLVEVLVAAVVIAVGLLGVAALQVTALKGASNANYRSRAIDIASILSDRIRANRNALTDYAQPAAPRACGSPPATTCSMVPGSATAAANCTPAQMAEFDLWDINCKIDNQFPAGTQYTVVCPDGCSANDVMEITVSWPTQEVDATNNTIFQQAMTTILPGSRILKPGEEL